MTDVWMERQHLLHFGNLRLSKIFQFIEQISQTVLYQNKKTILISALLYHRRVFQRTTSPSSKGMIQAKKLFPGPGMHNLPFLSHRVKSVTNEITKTRAAINFFGRPRLLLSRPSESTVQGNAVIFPSWGWTPCRQKARPSPKSVCSATVRLYPYRYFS